MGQTPAISSLLDTSIPHADVPRRHEIEIRAPAALVLETARMFEVRSVPLVRALFWLRAKIRVRKRKGLFGLRVLSSELVGVRR
jgi:hypothetical protein